MNFQNNLKEYQNLIDTNILELMNIDNTPKCIIEAMKYSLLAGGKRVRPVLAIAICKALGGNVGEVINLGCAIELIHTYSLIHDDLPAMDNDDLRRGKPSNHKVYGEAKAILAGDGLLTYAFEIIFNEAIKRNFDAKYIIAGETIARAAGVSGMIGGQVIDIENEGDKIEIEKLYQMHRKKTGALIEAACLVGCVIAERTEQMETVISYSENLGIAFQIIDDILDYTGDVSKLGKNVGSDEQNNKATFVSILGIDESIKLANDYSQKAKRYAEKIENLQDSFLVNLTDYLLHRES
jgi:geranylgeranyl diphosphate synthase, type II